MGSSVVFDSLVNSSIETIDGNVKSLKLNAHSKWSNGSFTQSAEVQRHWEIAYFSDCFHWNSELHGHSTRGKSIRVPINPSSNIGRCMFSYRAVLLWNSLPNDIQDSPTFYVFKLKLKKYLLRSTDTWKYLSTLLLYCLFTNFFLPHHLIHHNTITTTFLSYINTHCKQLSNYLILLQYFNLLNYY